ncbi:MAG: hypothetical protein OQL16_13205, partial [Gammaproteobacteria bacterium]|nr:hypothetical protein [Gammaproteobacteria bacterium]
MALLGKFGISGALDKVMASGDLDSPKIQPALDKLLENKKDAMAKVIERLESGPRIQYSMSLELVKMLLDNTTVEIVMQALPEFEGSTLHDVATLLNTSHDYDPHMLLPYMKEPLSLGICRDMIMAHRKEFTAGNLLKAAARTSPDLWDIIFELVHGHTDDKAFPEALALTKSKNATLRKYATGVIAEFNTPAAIEVLLSQLNDSDRDVYITALSGLTRMKASLPAARIFQLIQVMRNDDAHLLKALLGYSRDPQLMTFINKALFGKNTKLRLLAVQSLATIA